MKKEVVVEDLDKQEQHPLEQPLKKKSKFDDDISMNTSMMSQIHQQDWKPPLHQSYETMALADSQMNCKIRPCGFRASGKMRKIKNTVLIAKIKTRNRLKKKNPRLAVCITMYNENEQELKDTLTGVIHNYNELRNATDDIEFKKEDFVVFLICDGFDKISASFKEYATQKNFFDLQLLIDKGFMEQDRDKNWRMKDMRDIMDPGVDPKKVPTNIIHMFQVSTWDFGLDSDILKGRRINFVFAIKQRNDGKINSHKWFFQGLCKYLKPDYCLMLDIGTRPAPHAVFKLYKYMLSHQYCGGCCGEIEVDFSSDRGMSSSYFIKASQFYEYKMGHTPDKANESFFGFNSVLPGAYSLFRWKAIKGDPLDEFFKNVTRQDLPSCAEANEFLAEDRVMCLQIYIKKHSRYTLTYVPEAKAYTDAPPSLAVLIKQRRRWMNGALFGTMKVISNFTSMLSCGRTIHPWYKQFMMFFFLVYYVCTFLFQFFTVGSMYASITIFFDTVFKDLFTWQEWGTFSYWLLTDGGLAQIFDYTYIALILMAVVLSLTCPVDRAVPVFIFLMVMFGILMTISFVGILYYLAQTGIMACDPPEEGIPQDPNCDEKFQILVLAGIIMSCVFLIPMLLRPLDFLKNFTTYIMGMFAYLFMMPTYTNIMQIYAMCNLHDVSWGNRPAQGSTGVEALAFSAQNQKKLTEDYQVFRAYFVYVWMILNCLYAFLLIGMTNTSIAVAEGFLNGFAMFVAGLVMFKFIFATLYQIKWYFRMCCKDEYKASKRDVAEVFKELRKDKNKQESTDEEDNNDMEDEEEGARRNSQHGHYDEDDDDIEFEDAGEEEAQDRIDRASGRYGSSRRLGTTSQMRFVLANTDGNRLINKKLIESTDSYQAEQFAQMLGRKSQAEPKQQAQFMEDSSGMVQSQNPKPAMRKQKFTLGEAFKESGEGVPTSSSQVFPQKKSVRFNAEPNVKIEEAKDEESTLLHKSSIQEESLERQGEIREEPNQEDNSQNVDQKSFQEESMDLNTGGLSSMAKPKK